MRKSVLIVGGGFSGTVLAAQLLRRAPTLSIAVIDKNDVPARGLAYGTEHDCHLLNVCGADMTAFPDVPDHFWQWAQENWPKSNYNSPVEQPIHSRSFLPRSFYGRYIGSVLHEITAAPNSQLQWLQDEAIAIRCDTDGFVVERKSGPTLLARAVVIATGNFPPGNLGVPGLTKDAQRYVQQAWSWSKDKEALANLSDEDSILLVGSGLTSIDMAIALHSKKFRGKIHILSRHGLIPHSHKRVEPAPRFWDDSSPRTIRGLLRLLREQARAAEASGSDWRCVMDALRPLIQQVWQSLPIKEQRRFLRHAKCYWEVHRHRIAPEISRIFSSMIASGQIQIHAGRITNYSESPAAAEVTFRPRSSDDLQTLRVARMINCSGPQTDCRKINSPFLASLFEQQLVRQDALALGLDTDANGAVFDASGGLSRCLFAIGPLRKGRLWESTAVPDLRLQAAELAKHLLSGPLRDEANILHSENLVAR